MRMLSTFALLVFGSIQSKVGGAEPEPRHVTIKDGELLDLTHGKADNPPTYSKEVVMMFDAISANQPDLINKALDSGRVDINVRGPNGYTPLFESVLKHHVHSVELLLRRGANFRLRNDQGFDALDAAAFGGCAMCAHKLMRAGLDPETVRYDGFNTLHRAIWGDTPQHTETVKVILEEGVSPSKLAKVKGGEVHPLNMVNENDATKRLLEEWIEKEARGELPPKKEKKKNISDLSPEKQAELMEKLKHVVEKIKKEKAEKAAKGEAAKQPVTKEEL